MNRTDVENLVKKQTHTHTDHLMISMPMAARLVHVEKLCMKFVYTEDNRAAAQDSAMTLVVHFTLVHQGGKDKLVMTGHCGPVCVVELCGCRPRGQVIAAHFKSYDLT